MSRARNRGFASRGVRGARSKAPLLVVVVVVLAAMNAIGIGAQDSQGERIAVLVDFSGQWPEKYADSFAAALIQSPSVLSVARVQEGDEDVALLAARENCRVIISLSLSVAARSSRLEWSIRIPWRKECLAKGVAEGPAPDAESLATAFWSEPIAALEGAAASLDRYPSFLTIAAIPGTRIRGIGDDVVVPDSGTIDVPVALPSYIVWSASLRGAADEGGAILVLESGTLIAIPRPAKEEPPAWSVDTSALGFSFPELSLRKEVGERFFLRATFTQYLFGLALEDAGSPFQSLIASYNLIQPGTGIGVFWTGRSAAFRPYTSLDFFARVQVPSGHAASFDSVAPIGTTLALGFDWGRDPRLRIFGEVGITLYPWTSPVLMEASWNGEGEGRLTFGGAGALPGQPGWFAEFPVPRIGVRIGL
jgi:hypothetical protein